MSVYKPSASRYYRYNFQIKGNRIHGSTKATNRREATAIERELKERAKEEVKQRAKCGQAPTTFNAAAGRYWEEKGKFLKHADKHFARKERVRELREHGRITLGAAMRSDYMPWYLFAQLSGFRLSKSLIRWQNIDEEAG
jgi:hypothetical protein